MDTQPDPNLTHLIDDSHRFDRRKKTEAQLIVDVIAELTSDEPSAVVINHLNADFDGPVCVIEWNDELTGYNDERFVGGSLLEALTDALKTKTARKGNTTPHETDQRPGGRGDAGKLQRISELLTIMAASAKEIVDPQDTEGITGYQIKTGALHAIYTVLQEAGYPVELQLPGHPNPMAVDAQSVEVMSLMEAASNVVYLLKPVLAREDVNMSHKDLQYLRHYVTRLKTYTSKDLYAALPDASSTQEEDNQNS